MMSELVTLASLATEHKIPKFIIKIYNSLHEIAKYYKILHKYENDKNDIANKWAELIENPQHSEIYNIEKETKELIDRYNALRTMPYVNTHFDYRFKIADIYKMYVDDMNLVVMINDKDIKNEYNQCIRDKCIHEMIVMTEEYNKNISLLNTIFKDTNTIYAKNTIEEHLKKYL